MRATHIRAAVVASALTVCGVGHADPLKLELGVFGGWHYFATTNQLGRDVGSTSENRLTQSGTFGMRIGFVVHPRVSLEAELGLTPTSAKLTIDGAAQTANALALNYRAHLLVHLMTGRVRPFLLVGGGGNTLSSSNANVVHQDTDGELHAGAGIKFDVQKNWGFRLDGRAYFVPTVTPGHIYATADGEVTLGVYGLFGGAKKPEPAPAAAPAEPPCPNPDRDDDGVINAKDHCPDQAGPIENGGCPDKDTDGDGIVDRLDKCPNEPGSAETYGCPDRDRDNDKVPDRLDRCPDAAGPPENGGCPDTDSDNDGIADRLDKCPNEPETKNGYKDDDGCADELPRELKKYTGAVKGINFANGKADLLPSSNKALDDIVKVLTTYVDTKVEVDGFTDDAGDRNQNIDLSRARAETVRKYLVDHGIAEARVTAAGFGPDQPIASNKTAAGRAKNRRVELKLIN